MTHYLVSFEHGHPISYCASPLSKPTLAYAERPPK